MKPGISRHYRAKVNCRSSRISQSTKRYGKQAKSGVFWHIAAKTFYPRLYINFSDRCGGCKKSSLDSLGVGAELPLFTRSGPSSVIAGLENREAGEWR
jgi:hypothetical protein